MVAGRPGRARAATSCVIRSNASYPDVVRRCPRDAGRWWQRPGVGGILAGWRRRGLGRCRSPAGGLFGDAGLLGDGELAGLGPAVLGPGEVGPGEVGLAVLGPGEVGGILQHERLGLTWVVAVREVFLARTSAGAAATPTGGAARRHVLTCTGGGGGSGCRQRSGGVGAAGRRARVWRRRGDAGTDQRDRTCVTVLAIRLLRHIGHARSTSVVLSG